MKECSEGDGRPAIARGLCSMHYQRARLHGELGDRASMGSCAHCGKEFGIGLLGRPPLYCSERCKENARYARRRAEKGRRAEECENCGASLLAKPPQARFCSERCGQNWRNAQLQEKTRAAKLASRKPCLGCAGEIPPDRRANARYCSDACKLLSRRHEAYGITRAELDVLLAQYERCAICRVDNWGPKGPQVDHDHATGRVRGILCTSCNQGLGRFRDDPALLAAAARYLTG